MTQSWLALMCELRCCNVLVCIFFHIFLMPSKMTHDVGSQQQHHVARSVWIRECPIRCIFSAIWSHAVYCRLCGHWFLPIVRVCFRIFSVVLKNVTILQCSCCWQCYFVAVFRSCYEPSTGHINHPTANGVCRYCTGTDCSATFVYSQQRSS